MCVGFGADVQTFTQHFTLTKRLDISTEQVQASKESKGQSFRGTDRSRELLVLEPWLRVGATFVAG
jgi:hypothetical protein